MSGRRRRARELALQLLYQRDIAGTSPEEMFARTDEYRNAAPEVQEYASRLVLGTLGRLSELDELLGFFVGFGVGLGVGFGVGVGSIFGRASGE